jgi:hypothetical protein
MVRLLGRIREGRASSAVSYSVRNLTRARI